MKKIALLMLLSTLFSSYAEAQVHTTFEMRYITSDSKADGETAVSYTHLTLPTTSRV